MSKQKMNQAIDIIDKFGVLKYRAGCSTEKTSVELLEQAHAYRHQLHELLAEISSASTPSAGAAGDLRKLYVEMTNCDAVTDFDEVAGVCVNHALLNRFEKLLNELDTAPAVAEATVPDGWKLVPVVPTEEMLDAAYQGDRRYTDRHLGKGAETESQGAYDNYIDMLAAAPTPPAAQAMPLEGQEISVDVSTGEHDALRRVFARLTGEVESGVWLAEMTQDTQPAAQAGEEVKQPDMSAITEDEKSVARAERAIADSPSAALRIIRMLQAQLKEARATQPAAIRSAGLGDVQGETVAERLDAMADQCEAGSQMQSDLYAAATIWLKHINRNAASNNHDIAKSLAEMVIEWIGEGQRNDPSSWKEGLPSVLEARLDRLMLGSPTAAEVRREALYDPDHVAAPAATVHRRIDALCTAANTPDVDYFDASTNLMIAVRDLLKAMGQPHRMDDPAQQEGGSQ